MADINNVTFAFDPLEGFDIPRERRKEAREAVKQALQEWVFSRVGEGKSPVMNGPWKRNLTPEYKERKSEKSSALFANLELEGELLDNLKFRIVKGGQIETTVTNRDKIVGKAEGNNIGSYGKAPSSAKARRFIPLDGEGWGRGFENMRREILQNFIDTGTGTIDLLEILKRREISRRSGEGGEGFLG